MHFSCLNPFKSKRQYLTSAFLFFAFSCVPLSTPSVPSGPQLAKKETTTVISKEPVAKRGPNEIRVDSWQMPPTATRIPSFPYLPGEDQTISRSIGNVSFGYLISARAIQYPHPNVSMLRAHAGRNLIYTSDQMVELVEGAALYVREKHPDTVTFVGNFSAVGGGDIPYSVSHNSGRDADLAFFMTNEEGLSVEAPNLLPMDEKGKHETDSGEVYLFDTPKNWTLIEGLLKSAKGNLQLILISGPLKKMLLDYARENKVNKKTIARADALLLVPRSALPHDDHFHIRIRCSERDLESGCKNSTRRGRMESEPRTRTILRAEKALASDDARIRTMGLRRLAILQAQKSSKKIEDAASNDASPLVRASASRALGDLHKGYKSLRKNLRKEESPNVVAEIIWALSTSHSKSNAKALAGFLKGPHLGNLSDIETIDLRRLAIDSLVEFESKRPVETLIALVGSEDTEISKRAHRALTYLTNIDPTLAPKKIKTKKKRKKKRSRKRRRSRRKRKAKKTLKIERRDEKGKAYSAFQIWTQWWKINKRKRRNQWLVDGFRARGFDISKLNIKNIWDITRSISGEDYTSYNAQRVLMRMTGRRVDSLSWSKADASFNWRRWVERRIARLRAPAIPEELSTLKKK